MRGAPLNRDRSRRLTIGEIDFARVQKMTMIAEGAEAKRAEDALAERKRKAEEKERWEGAAVSLLLARRNEADALVCPALGRENRKSRRPRHGLAKFLERAQEEEEQEESGARLKSQRRFRSSFAARS